MSWGFAALRVPGKSALLSKSRKVFPPGEDLVHIRLVPGVPDEGIAGRIKNSVQGNGQLDNTEIRAKVPTGPGDLLDEEGSNLARELF